MFKKLTHQINKYIKEWINQLINEKIDKKMIWLIGILKVEINEYINSFSIQYMKKI